MSKDPGYSDSAADSQGSRIRKLENEIVELQRKLNFEMELSSYRLSLYAMWKFAGQPLLPKSILNTLEDEMANLKDKFHVTVRGMEMK